MLFSLIKGLNVQHMKKINYKQIQTGNIIVTLCALSASFYFQYVLGLTPCPLCLMQRACLFLLLLVMGLSFRTVKRAHYMSLMQIIFAAAGLFFAGRQLWLQSLPASDMPACMPGLDVLIHYFPWKTIARTLFLGTGDCAEVSWSLWGISMPGWCALYFSWMLSAGVYLFWSFLIMPIEPRKLSHDRKEVDQ